MNAPFLLVEADPRQMGLALCAVGLGVLAWGAFNMITGEASEGDGTPFNNRVIRRDVEPAKFRRTIFLTFFAGAVCLAASALLLI